MESDTELQLLDVKWIRQENHKQKYSIATKLYDTNANRLQQVELINYRFNWVLSKERYCVGYSKNNEYVPCKFSQIIYESKYERCASCEKEDGFKSAFLFRKEPNERMKEYLAKPQFIYLAYFEPGVIKVGTASIQRNRLRLLEQDAQSYCFIAELPDGIIVQDLERYISKTFNISELIRTAHKKKFIYQKSHFKDQKNILLGMARKVINELHDTKWVRYMYENEDLKVIDNTGHFYYPEETVEFINLNNYDYNLFGHFIGLRGNTMLLKNNENILGFNIKDISGRRIQSYSEGYNYNLGKEKPISLFSE